MENQLKAIGQKARENNVPVMKDGGIEFLMELLKTHSEIQRILEIGTAVGYSAMRMASVRDDIVIDTLEIDEARAKEAVMNIQQCGYSDRIYVHLKDAATYVTMASFDLIFIDAAKSQYGKYTEHFLPNAHQGTLFVYDNLDFHGIVDHPERSNNRSTLQMTRKIKAFRKKLLEDPRFETTFYEEVGDGVAVSRLR